MATLHNFVVTGQYRDFWVDLGAQYCDHNPADPAGLPPLAGYSRTLVVRCGASRPNRFGVCYITALARAPKGGPCGPPRRRMPYDWRRSRDQTRMSSWVSPDSTSERLREARTVSGRY
jgi:hypothetical protein